MKMSGTIKIQQDNAWVVGSRPCLELFERLQNDPQAKQSEFLASEVKEALETGILHLGLETATPKDFDLFADAVRRIYLQLKLDAPPYLERIRELLLLLKDDGRAIEATKVAIDEALA
jgi:hypothetical protein